MNQAEILLMPGLCPYFSYNSFFGREATNSFR